jgi:hypothetical protein
MWLQDTILMTHIHLRDPRTERCGGKKEVSEAPQKNLSELTDGVNYYNIYLLNYLNNISVDGLPHRRHGDGCDSNTTQRPLVRRWQRHLQSTEHSFPRTHVPTGSSLRVFQRHVFRTSWTVDGCCDAEIRRFARNRRRRGRNSDNPFV